MRGHIKYFVASVAMAALMGGMLGGMGSYWYFFWKNREMCPCAPQGIACLPQDSDDCAQIETTVAEPYSDIIMRRRITSFSLAGILLGTAAGLSLATPRARRLRKILSEIENEDV